MLIYDQMRIIIWIRNMKSIYEDMNLRLLFKFFSFQYVNGQAEIRARAENSLSNHLLNGVYFRTNNTHGTVLKTLYVKEE